jgi:hypothetical protein
MLAAEKNLLLAVRDALRVAGPYTEAQCDIEMDEQAPATAGDTYIVVTTGGWQPGPTHQKSGGVNDLIYAVDVGVVKRAGATPRDRRRNIFFRNLSSLDAELDKIFTAIDFEYDVMNAANALILAETGSTNGFIRPLVFTGMDRKPRVVPAEFFAGAPGENAAALMRTISFGGARRLTVK